MLNRVLQIVAGIYLLAVIFGIVFYKVSFIEIIRMDPLFGIYSGIVCAYILSRFALSAFYRPSPDQGIAPAVAIVMPAFNEEDAIARSVRALMAVDYPTEKLEIVVINDGSTDGTLAQIKTIAREFPRVHLIDFPENRGKRAAMAAGIRATSAEIVAFVDSDSMLEPDALTRLVQGFAKPNVGAVAGHADALNVHDSWITRMQAVRYFVAFRVCKAAESVLGAVTCCSGCFSAYRREAIMPILDRWENQHFLGRQATYGDDRSLTNFVLRSWKVHYEALAVSRTIVPADFRTFLRQQLRWKRSWTRESWIVSHFIWRANPAASFSIYLGIVLPLLAPLVAMRALLWQPLAGGGALPFVYLVGLYSMALVYGLYFAMRRSHYDALWVFGVLFVFFYLAFLLWQTYYAIATARNSSWGTRPSAPPEPDPPIRSGQRPLAAAKGIG
jgi:hyaluronan synthase